MILNFPMASNNCRFILITLVSLNTIKVNFQKKITFIHAEISAKIKDVNYCNKKELLSHQIYVTYKLALTFCENNEAHSTVYTIPF